MNTEIGFERARITAIELKPGSSGMSSRIKFVALATAKIARALGARWLLDKDALVKQGFTSVELDYAIKNVRAKHAIDKVASLELVSELVTKFKVFRKGDDAKKSKKLMVSFQVQYAGPLFELLEHVGKVGSGEGVCTLTVMQSEMFPTEQKAGKPRKSKRGAQQTLASAADVDPKRSASRERRKRGTVDPVTSDEMAVLVDDLAHAVVDTVYQD